MIDDFGDKTAVHFGGKGFYCITYKMRVTANIIFIKISFNLLVITINPGFPEFDEELLHNLCDNVGVP